MFIYLFIIFFSSFLFFPYYSTSSSSSLPHTRVQGDYKSGGEIYVIAPKWFIQHFLSQCINLRILHSKPSTLFAPTTSLLSLFFLPKHSIREPDLTPFAFPNLNVYVLDMLLVLWILQCFPFSQLVCLSLSPLKRLLHPEKGGCFFSLSLCYLFVRPDFTLVMFFQFIF